MNKINNNSNTVHMALEEITINNNNKHNIKIM